jgi:hypothetical protein
MIDLKIPLCGGIGGAFVPLFTASQDLRGPTHSLAFGGDWQSWAIGVLIMFALGAILAGVSRETIPLKALVIGISLPATITAYAENGTANRLAKWQQEQTTQVSQPQRVSFYFVNPAMAQSDAKTFVVSGLPSDASGYAVRFFGAGGPIGNTISLSGADAPKPVPPGATAVALRGPEGWSLPAPIDRPAQNGVLKLSAHARSNFVRGLGRAFGASAAPYEIEAR